MHTVIESGMNGISGCFLKDNLNCRYSTDTKENSYGGLYGTGKKDGPPTKIFVNE